MAERPEEMPEDFDIHKDPQHFWVLWMYAKVVKCIERGNEAIREGSAEAVDRAYDLYDRSNRWAAKVKELSEILKSRDIKMTEAQTAMLVTTHGMHGEATREMKVLTAKHRISQN